MTTHTPGPWERSKTARLCILGRNGSRFTICVLQNTHLEEQEANARLIVESPAMFEMLEKLTDVLDEALLTHIFDDPEEAAESDEMRLILESRTIMARVKGVA